MKAKWVDCKDALPPEGVDVWTWDGTQVVIRARYANEFENVDRREIANSEPANPPVLMWCAIEVPDAPEQM